MKRAVFSKHVSACLRQLLVMHLTRLFSTGAINPYLFTHSCEPEIMFSIKSVVDIQTLPQVKLAFNVWLGMCASDRHAVLAHFQQLYKQQAETHLQRALTQSFCVVFIQEFTFVLARAMQWPE